MAYTSSNKFHGYLDAKTRAYQVYKPDRGWTTTTFVKHITIQERTLSYGFIRISIPTSRNWSGG